MSASLVGSEMCIRDRGRLKELQSAGVAGPPRGGQQTAEKRTPRRVSAAAVSYTHLTLPTICSV
eukprot:7347073-Alexandrium_andersonii.AAC.1